MSFAAILAFLKTPFARYCGAAIIIGLVLLFVVHRWHGYQETLRQEGREQMAKQVLAVVQANDKNNRSIEQGVQTVLDSYGDRLDKSLDRLDARAREHQQTITKIIHDQPQVFNNPVCTTPQSVIDQRNAIRAEGPQ